MARRRSSSGPTKQQGAAHDVLFPLLQAIYGEVKELAKKKQDGALNALKVGMINKVLVQVDELLKEELSAEFLSPLDDETLPSNSDAVLVLAQYKAAMAQFKSKYYGYDSERVENRWFTSG